MRIVSVTFYCPTDHHYPNGQGRNVVIRDHAVEGATFSVPSCPLCGAKMVQGALTTQEHAHPEGVGAKDVSSRTDLN